MTSVAVFSPESEETLEQQVENLQAQVTQLTEENEKLKADLKLLT
jgi:cell division protein FtsB